MGWQSHREREERVEGNEKKEKKEKKGREKYFDFGVGPNFLWSNSCGYSRVKF
jgi:hypothetical protein